MRPIYSTLVLALLLVSAQAQNTNVIASQAFIVTRMVNKFHVQPRQLDDVFSADLLKLLLNKADGSKMYFTQSDINTFNSFATKLDDEIKTRQTSFLDVFVTRYQQRLQQADSLVKAITAKKIDLMATEMVTPGVDANYVADLNGMRLKWYQYIKSKMVDIIADIVPSTFKGVSPQEKKFLDSLEVVVRNKMQLRLHNRITRILEFPSGFSQYTGNLYCKAIALCYDPHTEFFPQTEKENFESALGQQPFRFGFRLKASPTGGSVIDNLQPGSPAFKSGKLHSGDKIMQLQWEGKAAIDVSSSSTGEVSQILDASNHDKLLLTVKTADGKIEQVPLMKEQMEADDDEDKVKSFVLKGSKNIGYIYLPAFYSDWEDNSDGVKGCANDVAREIIKLKKENIQGVILDLRYNGGGSVMEAVDLAGIFIDAGPVAQFKTKEPKPITLKDGNRGTVFDGPLVIIVNGYSASASELIAGTLQDYHRAVIVGTPTFGKATGQRVFPMDTTITYENADSKRTTNYIKITTSLLYRVNGTTAQAKGVQPDIFIPDVLQAYAETEAEEPNVLQVKPIDPNKYYTPLAPIAINTAIQQEVKDNSHFKAISELVLMKDEHSNQAVDISLKAALQRDAKEAAEKDDDEGTTVSTLFTVENNNSELSRLATDEYARKLNDAFKKHLSIDAALEIAFKVALQLK